MIRTISMFKGKEKEKIGKLLWEIWSGKYDVFMYAASHSLCWNPYRQTFFTVINNTILGTKGFFQKQPKCCHLSDDERSWLYSNTNNTKKFKKSTRVFFAVTKLLIFHPNQQVHSCKISPSSSDLLNTLSYTWEMSINCLWMLCWCCFPSLFCSFHLKKQRSRTWEFYLGNIDLDGFFISGPVFVFAIYVYLVQKENVKMMMKHKKLNLRLPKTFLK